MGFTLSGVKIEKLLAYPTEVQPNRFYLVEFGDITKLYLSDSKSVLHLLNGEESISINTDDTVILTPGDSGNIYLDLESGGFTEYFLPEPEEGLFYEFWVYYGNGIRVFTNESTELIKYALLEENTLESDVATATIKIHSFNGNWVTRYATGEWSLGHTLYNPLVFLGDGVTFGGNPLIFNP